MNRLSIPLKALFVLSIVTLLAACVPGQSTPDAAEVQSAIETAVAQTVEAQGEVATSVALTVAAREAEAAAEVATEPPEPEDTPTPLPTLTPVLPTATPLSVSNGSSGGTSGGSGGSTSYAYSCDIIHQRPIDNTEFKRTNTFDVRFAILNTGTATWEMGKDLTLLDDHGVLVTPFTTLELPNDLAPGEYWEIGPYDAMAPSETGHYVIDFKLEGGFCYPYVAFDVVR